MMRYVRASIVTCNGFDPRSPPKGPPTISRDMPHHAATHPTRDVAEENDQRKTPFSQDLATGSVHSRFLRQLLSPPGCRRLAAPAISMRRAQRRPHVQFSACRIRIKQPRRVAPTAPAAVMATLIVRDVGGVVERGHCLRHYRRPHHQLRARFPTSPARRPVRRAAGQAGRPQRLLVIGMGKLATCELNVSSDVDYIFVYPEDGERREPRTADGGIEVFDFFTRLGKRLIAAIGEITGDGQVFRVDMRLRPNGDSGPLVGSIASLENYLSPKAVNGNAMPGSRPVS